MTGRSSSYVILQNGALFIFTVKQKRIHFTDINRGLLIITVKSSGLSETELKAKTLFNFYSYEAMTGALKSNGSFILFV
jgi:hypothetical protein